MTSRARSAAEAFAALAAVVFLSRACPVARWLHVPCPGCGTTRALALMLCGSWRASLALAPFALPLTAAIVCAMALERGVWPRRRAAVERVIVVVAVAATVFWGARFFGVFGGPVPVD